ncbi:MAG: tyrosine-type recombinase/integrase [Clostridium sp.]|nr:tyrosine-type recombinase/integrase [Clostridium sp.]
MAKNLKYQFLQAIETEFTPGVSKHSLKKTEGLGNGRIFSYADRKNLVDFSANFANFITSNYPKVKYARDIKVDQAQSFINNRAGYCTYATITQYVSKLRKLNILLDNVYGSCKNFSKVEMPPVTAENTKKLRTISMPNEEFLLLREYLKNRKSKAIVGIELAGRFALRASEVVKLQTRDVNLEKNEIYIIDSKGGKSRTIKITEEEDYNYLKEIVKGKEGKERLVPLKEDSVNKFLKRSLNQCGIGKKYKDAKTGIHSIRKMAADIYFNRCLDNGMTTKEATQETSVYIGHGKDRKELMEGIYVKTLRE